jgi:hypothetical protein
MCPVASRVCARRAHGVGVDGAGRCGAQPSDCRATQVPRRSRLLTMIRPCRSSTKLGSNASGIAMRSNGSRSRTWRVRPSLLSVPIRRFRATTLDVVVDDRRPQAESTLGSRLVSAYGGLPQELATEHRAPGFARPRRRRAHSGRGAGPHHGTRIALRRQSRPSPTRYVSVSTSVFDVECHLVSGGARRPGSGAGTSSCGALKRQRSSRPASSRSSNGLRPNHSKHLSTSSTMASVYEVGPRHRFASTTSEPRGVPRGSRVSPNAAGPSRAD